MNDENMTVKFKKIDREGVKLSFSRVQVILRSIRETSTIFLPLKNQGCKWSQKKFKKKLENHDNTMKFENYNTTGEGAQAKKK